MILGFTGTRSGPTPAQRESMRRFIGGMPLDRLVHGGAPGCDTFAHWIMRELHSRGVIDIYPAIGDVGSVLAHIGQTLLEMTMIHAEQPMAERDKDLVDVCHGLLAVPKTDRDDGSDDVWTTVRRAREAGKPVYVIQQNGRIARYK